MLIGAAAVAAPAHAFLYEEFEVFTPPDPDDVGQFSVDQHFNYGLRGRRVGEYPRALPTQGGLYLNTELTYGVAPRYAISLELPSAVTADGAYSNGGFKLRNVFGLGSAGTWSFGLLAEVQRQPRRFLPNPWGFALSPLLAWSAGSWSAALNLGFGATVGRRPAETFLAPAARAAYAMSGAWTVAAEYFGELGRPQRLEPFVRQGHQVLGVVEADLGPVGIRFGIGRGLTAESERWIGTVVLSRTF